VLALLPAEAAVVELPLRLEAAVAELPRRAEAAVVELPLHLEAAVAELPRRAEAAAELPRRAEAAAVESQRRAEGAYAPRWLEAFPQEALKRRRTADCRRCYPWRYRCRWLFRHAAAHREAHDCPAESQCCRCRFSYWRRRYPRWQVTARQEVCDCWEASRCWLRGRLSRPWCPATARREARDYPEWSRHYRDRFLHLDLPARCRSRHCH
jgi:hypothetical protein